LVGGAAAAPAAAPAPPAPPAPAPEDSMNHLAASSAASLLTFAATATATTADPTANAPRKILNIPPIFVHHFHGPPPFPPPPPKPPARAEPDPSMSQNLAIPASLLISASSSLPIVLEEENSTPLPPAAPPSPPEAAPRKPILIQSGGGNERDILIIYCDSILMILLLQMSNKHYDFLEKAEDTIREMGQEPFVYDLLKKILQEIPKVKTEIPQESYIFSEFPHVEGLRILEKAFHKHFTKSEISVLKGLSIPKVIYSRKPKEFQYALGTGGYSLEGSPEEAEITPMYGIEHDIDLTRDERELIEKGGIPVGALIFLYMVCLGKIL